MESLLIGNYMVRHPLVLTVTMSLDQAAEALLHSGQSGAPVTNDQQQVVGFVSEQELLKLMVKDVYHCELHATVADVMRTDVLTVSPQDSILALGEQMLCDKPKIYPVLDEGKLVGIISRSRVLAALNDHMKQCFRNSA
ncbi:CBS domain-containing protein [Ferrimonas senticii]|uniref:CBS domain-containing protein n=1 Tax=Ferrimonas senticii TaxID=394566 RepID=UPI00041E862D|nr:CBS domain-containing protein [Ferrimonas senticii]